MKKRRGNGDVHVLRMVLTAVALIVVLVLGGRAVSGDADVTRSGTTPSSVTETVTVGRGEKKFGDKCVEDQECGFDGSICDKSKGMCQCLPELQATNHLDKCGKIVAVRNDCDFDEQCSMTTPQTECRDGKCMCQGNMHPYVKDNITQCFVRGEKKIGDKCEESLDCGYDGGVCDKTKKPICQCSPELPVTNHIDKCGKGDPLPL